MKDLMKLPELNIAEFELTLKQLQDNVVHDIISKAGQVHVEELNLFDNLRMHCTALVICSVILFLGA